MAAGDFAPGIDDEPCGPAGSIASAIISASMTKSEGDSR